MSGLPPLLQDWLVGTAPLSAWELLGLFTHFLMLSLLAVGGALTTAPDMQRYLVHEQGWLNDTQFTAGVALAQAAPGPNVLFVAVLGFQVAGLAGVLATLTGTLLPSTVLALSATRWSARHAQSPALQAFTTGMAPLTLGLLLATAAVLLQPVGLSLPAGLLLAATVAWMLGTKRSPLWPIGAGALCGALGWV
ncbi:chromate transporter [Rubrivivax rivuli]|uniref:Chromate transporter n=1 Tax=Rubrivivax rivuli TaxID=1862385 RepID=A0A437RI97_9BURK|nr:chromate transporter [Rubrivivax rivuli]RVU46471.1 chromate transporter [Rubrivivax rivuli]